ncbi:amidase family protein [Klenkia sp. LSe6-5]|uniref:Amidase family protein n=1 Tax=Klenkia sesuvii TaxID=3103137 RepID=A0ABU8DWG8_9ACTN
MDTLLDGTTMLAALAAGEVSAEELTRAHLDRIAGPGAALNALVAVDTDAALAAARTVDADRAAGRPLGPLAGLPITVKDSVDARGLPSSHGRPDDRRLATTDAPAVRRLRQAGCVVLGKTNVPVWLASMHSENALFGATVNPWDTTRSSGGSSGGSSAAVAAGLGVADLGSDLAGSLRVPAAWCGLFGHRPSNGAVSKLGNLPWPDGGLLEPMVSAIGPFARSAADTALFSEALFGAEGIEAVGWQLRLPPARVSSLTGLRIAVWLDDPAAPVDPEVATAVRGFADRLADAGAQVAELVHPPVGGPGDLQLYLRLQSAEIVHGFTADDLAAADDRYHQSVWAALRDLEAQRAATARWAETFTGVDVVLCPAVSRVATTYTPAMTAPETVEVDGREVPIDSVCDWARLSSLGRLPATVVPLGPGEVSGLPVGAQLLGAYLEDRTPLAIARLAEEAGLVGFRRPPGW